MKRINRKITSMAVLLWVFSSGVHGLEVLSTDKLSLNVYGRGQMIGVGENVPDPIRSNNRVYLFLKQARIGFRGTYDEVKFDTQFAFGGESANGTNTDLSLLDFVADIPVKKLGEDTWFKIGQFRVPYSREGLTNRGYMNFGERSVANLGSYQSRDYGLAILATKGVWTGTFGTFSSGGRDVPQRYLPEILGIPEVVARIGYNDGVDEDIYHVVQTDIDLQKTSKAFYVNGLYLKDTLIGHSSALQVRTIDKNLLIETGFNPYINQGGGSGLGTIATPGTMQRGHLWFVGGDAVIRHPLGTGRALEAEAEVNWGGYQNRFGVIHLTNYRVQGAYQFQPFAVALRYAVLDMDEKSGFLTSAVGSGAATTPGASVNRVINNNLDEPIHEITPSVAYYLKGHNIKVVLDTPIYLNCPLWYDTAGRVGVYAFPDPTGTTQNSLLATSGNSTKRRTVIEARMMFQFMF